MSQAPAPLPKWLDDRLPDWLKLEVAPRVFYWALVAAAFWFSADSMRRNQPIAEKQDEALMYAELASQQIARIEVNQRRFERNQERWNASADERFDKLEFGQRENAAEVKELRQQLADLSRAYADLKQDVGRLSAKYNETTQLRAEINRLLSQKEK